MFLGRGVVVRRYRGYGGESRVVDVCERLSTFGSIWEHLPTKEVANLEAGNVFDCLNLLSTG